MGDLLKLVRTSEVLEGSPVAVKRDGLPPLAVYRVGDELFVTNNICTHGHALLTEGYQEGNTIECPFHGGAFDIRTGQPTEFPCVVPLQTYDAVIADDHVCVTASDHKRGYP